MSSSNRLAWIAGAAFVLVTIGLIVGVNLTNTEPVPSAPKKIEPLVGYSGPMRIVQIGPEQFMAGPSYASLGSRMEFYRIYCGAAYKGDIAYSPNDSSGFVFTGRETTMRGNVVSNADGPEDAARQYLAGHFTVDDETVRPENSTLITPR